MRYRFMQFPGGKMKAVTLSYDDGVKQDLRFIEVINRYGLKCTFNINSGFILEAESERYLTAEDVRKHMLGNGHEIAVHGKYHRAPGVQRPIDGIQDVLNCRLELEKEYGIIVRGMAYPDSGINRFQNGAEYSEIRSYLKYMSLLPNLDGTFDHVKYFGVSSFNFVDSIHNDMEDVNTPGKVKFACSSKRLELPFIWMLKQFDLIK